MGMLPNLGSSPARASALESTCELDTTGVLQDDSGRQDLYREIEEFVLALYLRH